MDEQEANPIKHLTAHERLALAIPDREPDLISDGFAQWEDYEGDELPVELPATPPNLNARSSATASGLGRVQVAMVYGRSEGKYLVVVLETCSDGRQLLAADAEDIRHANALLDKVIGGWTFIGWDVHAHFAGTDDSVHQTREVDPPIDLQVWRRTKELRAQPA